MVWRLMTIVFLLATNAAMAGAERVGSRQESKSGITHSFLAAGAETYIIDPDATVLRRYPEGTRDGWLLPNGNLLLAITKSNQFPGGAALELTAGGEMVFRYDGRQSEVNTVQKLADDRYMLTEAGPKPTLLEVDHTGKVLVEVPLQAQTRDLHLQTRMARKLPNGNYLVPQLLDKVVREYTPAGKVVWEARTPESPPECWPFTAIRLPSGNTLVTCTPGAIVVEFDGESKIVWQLSNADLPRPLLRDPCGAQRLSNGNTVIASYGESRPGEVKLLEVTSDKQLVWTCRDDKNHGIHEFQILTTNGGLLGGTPMK